MKLAEAKRLFIEEYYGTKSAYRRARRDDYCKVQLEWSCFMDCLCESGQITAAQYDRATF